MGVDPTSKKAIRCKIEDPKFTEGYFKYLHHPHEDRVGVDFWWNDWQHGNTCSVPGLNPLVSHSESYCVTYY